MAYPAPILRYGSARVIVKEKTLLLAAHGSSRPDENSPVRMLADRLKATEVFDDVLCGFLKEAPFLNEILPSLEARDLIVVPLLTSRGFITDELIPEALKTVPKGTRVHLCPPLGVHDGIPRLMVNRVEAVLQDQDFERKDVSVIIAAHGNKKNPENARQTREIAQSIENLLTDISVQAAFIEQPPLLSDWPENVTTENLIVLPLLIGGGLHGAEDVPTMLGIDLSSPELACLSEVTPHTGRLTAHGRSIVLCRALGYEPALAKIVTDLARKI